MSTVFEITGVPEYTQRDNQYLEQGKNVASISCFPTSVGMSAAYALSTIGLDKTAIGCGPEMQIEDYFNQTLSSPAIYKWEKSNVEKLGSWIWGYKPRTIYAVEAQAFNMLMNPHGFKATARDDLNYASVCALLEKHKLPFVIGGNFKSVSKVDGHLNCLIGFNQIGLQEFIVHDPYGDALLGYAPDKKTGKHNGARRHYSAKFYERGKNKTMNVLVIERI